MSEKMAIELMGRMQSSVIIYTLLSGATFLLLSPARLFLSPLIDPIFVGENVINNLIVLSVFSLFGGLPLFLVKDLIYGNGGLNEKLARRLRKTQKASESKEKKDYLTFSELNITSADLAAFMKWAHETELLRQLDFINVESHILGAFIVASEICFPLNLIGLGVAALFAQQFFSLAYILLINSFFSFLIGLLSWIYEKYYFRKYKRDRLTFIGASFQKYKKTISKLI